MLKKSNSILQFLNPTSEDGDITNSVELDKFINSVPKFTLLPKDFFQSLKNTLPFENILGKGNWVQIGVWKGGGALFLKALMEDLDIHSTLYLFDTFGSIPVNNLKHKEDIEFTRLLNTKVNTNFSNYKNGVVKLFEDFNLYDNVVIVEQDINYLSPHLVPNNIAFLHLDVDFFEATFSALTLFYDRIIPGGIIIIDDYYMTMLNCKNAVDLFIEKYIPVNSIEMKKFSSYSLLIKKKHDFKNG